jgi:hypothetical protein
MATADELYDELDELTAHRQREGRGRTPEAAHVREYCKQRRAQIKRQLRKMGAPTSRPGDDRRYGPGQSDWQRAGR